MASITVKKIALSFVVILASLSVGTAFAQDESPYETISWTDEKPASPTSDDGTAYPNDSVYGTNSPDRTGADAPISPAEESR